MSRSAGLQHHVTEPLCQEPWAHERFPQIKLEHMIGNPAHVPINQLWGSEFGAAH